MEQLYPQFIREKQYLQNVSPNTVEAYEWAWQAFEPPSRRPTSFKVSKNFVRGGSVLSPSTPTRHHPTLRGSLTQSNAIAVRIPIATACAGVAGSLSGPMSCRITPWPGWPIPARVILAGPGEL